MQINIQKYTDLTSFLSVIEGVNKEDDPTKIPLKDLLELLKINSGLVENTNHTSSEQITQLDQAFFPLKERCLKVFEGKEAQKILKACKKFRPFKQLYEITTVPKTLQECKGQLREIYLEPMAEISNEIFLSIIKDFPNLKALSVALDDTVTPESFQELKTLKNLKHLKITDFGDLDPNEMIGEVISKMTGLESLHIGSSEELTLEGIQPLIKLTKLEKLVVHENNISSNDLTEFALKMPNLKQPVLVG